MTLDTLDGIQLIALRNDLTAIAAKMRERAKELRVSLTDEWDRGAAWGYNQAADLLEAALEGSADG